MKKDLHGFLFLYMHVILGLALAALRAAGAPLKPFATCTHTFSRQSRQLYVFAWSIFWPNGFSATFLIKRTGHSDYVSFGFYDSKRGWSESQLEITMSFDTQRKSNL